MKENIETLQEENQQLTTEIHEVKAIINSVPVESVPFKLEPIVPNAKN
jgi:hypothetical protein